MPAHRQKGVRIGPLKTVNRLFRVADGKDRAQSIAGAFARKELLGERGHDLPLLGVGVLRLID